MPIIKQIFNETVTDYTTTVTISVPVTTQVYPQTSVNGTMTIKNITDIANSFFKNLKSCLEQTELSITFDDTEYSFTVFGMKFYCFCYNSAINPVITSYSVIPTIQRYGQYNTTAFKTITTTGNATANFGFDRNASIIDYNDNELLYQINIHYNTNFLYITYGSKININATYPLCCIIKCQTVEGIDCIYTSLNPNIYSITSTTYSMINYHHITMVDKPYINYPSSGNMVINSDNLFTKIHHQNLTAMHNFFDKTKIVKIQPICMQGIMVFGENCIAGPYNISPGYYEIDEETYFCPGDTLYDSVIQNLSSNLANCQKLLLKI